MVILAQSKAASVPVYMEAGCVFTTPQVHSASSGWTDSASPGHLGGLKLVKILEKLHLSNFSSLFSI